ncbi:sigma-54-dependent Fis family transcriptional regulator [Klebsiella pneumoniae]|uniref:sigma-54-dependent Fis family transcriptional regulator n=1 Tax=Klebsiella pneumoniae TaxID=573 RepID=UPI00155256E9|nr:sigma-54-dependent Fis family transcriptional regulator [Klebsiella pneumoniae]
MLSNNCSILLIDDDADVLDAYTQLLEQAGYHVSACNNPFDAREQVPKDWPGIVLSDVCMPGCSGIDLMTVFHQDDDLLPILLITGHGDVPMAVEAVKKGAWDFLQKPIDPGKLLTLVDAALRQRQSVIARRQYCQQKLQVELIGRSQWTVRYRQRLQQLAETDIAVWLYGEPGTGRMTGARYLHQLPLAETVNPLMHIGEPTPLDQRVEDVERQIITEALNIHQGRINEVAEYLLIPRKKLYLRMKKYGLNKEHYKGV